MQKYLVLVAVMFMLLLPGCLEKPTMNRLLDSVQKLSDTLAEELANIRQELNPAIPAATRAERLAKVNLVSSWGPDRADKETVSAFLEEFSKGLPVIRHRAVPMIRIGASANERERKYVADALDLINPHLPSESRIFVGRDVPDRIGNLVPNGEIWIDFALRQESPLGSQRSLIVGRTNWHELSRDPQNSAFSSHIWIDKEWAASNVNPDTDNPAARAILKRQSLALVVHEILHAVGFTGHAENWRWGSLMESLPMGLMAKTDRILNPIDKDGLSALYMLEIGQHADELGPWNQRNEGLSVWIGQDIAAAGVDLKAWGPEAWVKGTMSTGDVRSSVQGNAVWSGRLVGYSPQMEAVEGMAEVMIDLAVFTGDLVFDELRYSQGNAWNDGNLAYQVVVEENSIVRAGGDAGKIDAAFYGDQHEAVAGTLSRQDLLAAFGASR